MKKIISLALALTVLCSAFGAKKIKVLTIGDSTMANYDEVKNSDKNEMRGWGQLLQMYFNDQDVIVENIAKNGRSSKSFYYEFWEKKRETIKKGDYVVIQFGHNDEKNHGEDSKANDRSGRGTAAWGQYQEYLTRYINETRKRGGIPILATPIVRALFNEDGKSLQAIALHNMKDKLESDNDTLYDYVLAMKDVARRLNVPIVDMTTMTEKTILDFGYPKAKRIIHCNRDDTHLKACGALMYAGLFARDLKKQGILSDYIQCPTDITLDSQEFDFGATITGETAVKTFQIYGVDQKKEHTIEVSAPAPFGVSLSPRTPFASKIQFESNTDDFIKPVFVQFMPTKGKTAKEKCDVIIDGVKHEIPLVGTGISADKKTAFAYQYSAKRGLYSHNKKAELKTNLVGLKYIVDLNETSLTTTDGHWIPDEIDVNSNRYFEISIKAKKDMFLSRINYKVSGAKGEVMQFTALGSFDKSFADADTYSLMSKVRNKPKVSSQKVMIRLKKGKTYYFRIYPWSRTGGDNSRIKIDYIVFRGFLTK